MGRWGGGEVGRWGGGEEGGGEEGGGRREVKGGRWGGGEVGGGRWEPPLGSEGAHWAIGPLAYQAAGFVGTCYPAFATLLIGGCPRCDHSWPHGPGYHPLHCWPCCRCSHCPCRHYQVSRRAAREEHRSLALSDSDTQEDTQTMTHDVFSRHPEQRAFTIRPTSTQVRVKCYTHFTRMCAGRGGYYTTKSP